MFFEDTSFDSVLNHESNKVFDVVNRVINDQVKKQNNKQIDNNYQIDHQIDRQINHQNKHQINRQLSNQSGNQKRDQNFDNSFNHQQFNQTIKQPKYGLDKPISNMNFNNSPLFLTPSHFSDSNNNITDNFIDKSDHLKNVLINHNLNSLNSPSSISSPNHQTFSNYFQFHPSSISHQNHLLNPHDQNNSPFNNLKQQRSLLTSKQTNLNQSKLNLPARIWHERPKPSIHTLHPEIWAIIFKNLNIRDKGRIARTCTFFRDVVYGKSIWKGEIARLHLKRRHSVVLESLTRRGIQSIQVLSLQRGLKEISQFMPKLRDLVLTGCFNLTDEKIITALSCKLSNLQELSLSMCKHITDISIIHISEHLTSLIKLDVSGCPNISDQSLIALVKGLRQLKLLNLRSCRNITHKGLAYICGYKPPEGTINQDDDQMDVDSDQELAIALDMEQPKVDLNSALVNLEELILQDCQKLNDDVLRYVPLGLSQLKSINLSFCVGITEFGLKNLANHPNLESINLCHCNNVGDIGLRYLSEANLSKLINLDVSFCDKVNDQALSYISQGLKELRVLSLNSCSITDNGLIKIGQNLIKLNTLNVGQCTKITDKSLSVIIENCVNLQTIDLYGCTRITTVSLEKLSRLPKLNKLNLDLKSQEEEDKTEQTTEQEFNEVQLNDEQINQQDHLFSFNNFGQQADQTVDENNNVNNFQSNYVQNWIKDPYQLMMYNQEVAAVAANAVFTFQQQQAADAINNLNPSYYIQFPTALNLASPFLYQPLINGQLNNSQQLNQQVVLQPFLNPHTFMQSLASENFKYKNF